MKTRSPSSLAQKKVAIAALEEIKARDIVVIDVKKLTSLFDTVIVATAESARQTKSCARNVRDRLKESGAYIIGTEGEDSGDWVLVDAGDIVVHIMQPAIRAYYALEELWDNGKRNKVINPSLPPEIGPRREAAAHGPPGAVAPAPGRKATGARSARTRGTIAGAKSRAATTPSRRRKTS
jgi:ribosome-associated protein